MAAAANNWNERVPSESCHNVTNPSEHQKDAVNHGFLYPGMALPSRYTSVSPGLSTLELPVQDPSSSVADWDGLSLSCSTIDHRFDYQDRLTDQHSSYMSPATRPATMYVEPAYSTYRRHHYRHQEFDRIETTNRRVKKPRLNSLLKPISYEDTLLLKLRSQKDMSWRLVKEMFSAEVGAEYTVAALQMRHKRLKDRLAYQQSLRVQ